MPDNSRTPQARAAAVKVLMDCLEKGRPLHNLPAHGSMRDLSVADRSLAGEIIHGVLRNLLRCDYLIKNHADIGFSRLDPQILWILRISVYQLDFMSAPEYAVVDDAVRLARYFGKPAAAGFVNGVLRSFLRQRDPLPAGNSVASLSIRFSHPGWLVKRFIFRYGVKKARKIMARNNLTPESYIRINPSKTSVEDFCRNLEDEGIPFAVFPALPDCLKIGLRGFNRHRLYIEGHCFYMDYGSQMVAARVGAEPGMIIGDFCAAPGGKSFILSSRTGPGGSVIAGDISRNRLLQMKKRIKLYGIDNCSLICADVEASVPVARGLDAILLDVPCSGLGTIRSNPDIRWLFKEENLLNQKVRQSSILRNGFQALEKGRNLFYTSCSTEPEENEEVVRKLLLDEPAAELVGEPYYTLADQDEGEGFFIAVIRRA